MTDERAGIRRWVSLGLPTCKECGIPLPGIHYIDCRYAVCISLSGDGNLDKAKLLAAVEISKHVGN